MALIAAHGGDSVVIGIHSLSSPTSPSLVVSVDVKQHGLYWAIQRSWFARVNALCNDLSRKKSREVAAHFRADF